MCLMRIFHIIILAAIVIGGVGWFTATIDLPRSEPPETASAQQVSSAGIAEVSRKLDILITEQQKMTAARANIETILQNTGGGRYSFLSHNNQLIRLDHFEGKVAFFNDASGPRWFTLRIEEQELRPSDSFFQQYINALKAWPFPPEKTSP